MESSRFANPFNKIGFHIDDDPDFDPGPLYDWIRQLDVAGIPIFLKSKDNYGPIRQALEWVKGSDVPHTFLYRMCRIHTETKSEQASFNFDEPNYELDPKEAANQHWRAILSNLPSEFDPSQVWLEILHKPDESYANWLGFFALEIGQMALEQGFRLALFGWGNRQPSREAWYQEGLVEFLHLCEQRPDQLAISLHEYSQNPETLFETSDSGIGYFQELVAAARDKEMQPPTIFISEWGWGKEQMPNPELALEHIHQAGQLYANFPEVQGAALWTLGQESRIGKNAERLIRSLTDFSLNVRFDGDGESPIIEDANYTSDYSQTTASITEDTDPYDDTPDYSSQFLADVTIPDGTKLEPGSSFIKKWRVKNNGRLPWTDDCQLFYSGDADFAGILGQSDTANLTAVSIPLPNVPPGDEGEIQIELTAPTDPGTYQLTFDLLDPQSNPFSGDNQLTSNFVITDKPGVPDYDARFLNHVTIADGTEIPPGRFFDKAWRVRNDGRLPWKPSFQIVQQDNTPLGETLSFPIFGKAEDPSETEPGQLTTLRINLSTPSKEGPYTAVWRLQNDRGDFFGDPLTMSITVIPDPDIAQEDAPDDNLYDEDPNFEEVVTVTDHSDDFGESFDPPIQQPVSPETKGGDHLFISDETEAESKAKPRQPAVWFYIANSSDQQQLDYLTQAPEVTWAANKNSKRGDLILMYRDGRHQDFAYLFHALDDAHEQDPDAAPTGWDEKWTHAINLGQKQVLDSPVSRHLLKTHPDLRNWRPISHSPQGIMSRREGLNQGIGGQARWHAIRGLLVGWNPNAADYLAKFDQTNTVVIMDGAITAVSQLPEPENRRQGLINISQFMSTMSEFADLQAKLSQDSDWQVRAEASRQLGQPLTPADVLDEANRLRRRALFQKTITFLEKEAPDWQSGTPLQQAQAQRLLAESAQQLGQRDKALTHWQTAVRLNPNDIEAAEALARLTPPDKRDETEKFFIETASFAETASGQTEAAGPAVGRAILAAQTGDTETAASHLDEAKKQAPENARRRIETIERRIIETRTTPTPASGLADLSPDPITHKRQTTLIQVLREFFKESELKDLCFKLNVDHEEITGENKREWILEFVLAMTRDGRLTELVETLKEIRPQLAPRFQETAADIIAAARAQLRQQQPEAAIATLQDKAAMWQVINDPALRADAHAILAQAYEATGQTDLAHAQWKLKAPLTPNAIDAYRGLVRTAVETELDELKTWLEEMRRRQPTAVGPLTGLAALLSRQNKPTEAANLLAAANTGNPTQDRALHRTAEALPANFDTALEALGGTAVSPSPDSNRLTEAITDLAAAHIPLDANDQISVFREIIQQILELPTLSPADKRDFGDRARRVLADVRQTGQFTPQHAADLRLPALDNLFITDPPRRRALANAAAAYRQQNIRRLRLYLRSRARKQMRAHLKKTHIESLLANNGADRQTAFTELQTAVFQTGTVNNIEPKAWLAQNEANGRALREWRETELTITGNLCHDLPAHLLQPFPANDPAIWQAIFDLRYNDSPLFQRQDSWSRMALVSLDEQISSLILWAFAPDEHLPFHPETAAAALQNLDLPDRAQSLDYDDYIAFARQLLQDDDLGFASLDDVACFLAQIADDEDKTVVFAPGDAPASYDDLLPPLADKLLMPVNAFDTPLTLSDSTFSQMAHALSAGNHIILIGPPGTGKTSIALDICALAHDLNASRGVIAVTATADWTTFDTVGGYMPNDDGRLTFREGVLLRAIREGKWVIIDEINRAEIDKAFGELFTVLSGQPITLPYRDGSAPIRIVPADFPGKTARDYVIPPGWRIIGTMNVFDKASLFEMSSAFMRRFAFVDVGIPRPNAVFMGLIDRWLAEFGLPTEAENEIVTALKTHIFAEDSAIMQHRQLGPAIARDIIRYVAQCQEQGEPIGLQHVGEAFLLYAIPQFDGLDEPTVITIHKHLQTTFADTGALQEIHRRMQDLFPQYELALVKPKPAPEPVEEEG